LNAPAAQNPGSATAEFVTMAFDQIHQIRKAAIKKETPAAGR